jgi:hypothetical protein
VPRAVHQGASHAIATERRGATAGH